MSEKEHQQSNGAGHEPATPTITKDEIDEAVERAAEEPSETFRITKGQRKALSSSGDA